MDGGPRGLNLWKSAKARSEGQSIVSIITDEKHHLLHLKTVMPKHTGNGFKSLHRRFLITQNKIKYIHEVSRECNMQLEMCFVGARVLWVLGQRKQMTFGIF